MRQTLLKIIFGTVCFTAIIQSSAQTSTLKIKFIGKEYEKLTLSLDNNKIEGISTNGKDWVFTYPDSVYAKHGGMNIRVGSADSVYHNISFSGVAGNDTIKVISFGVPKNYQMTLNYFKSDSAKNVAFYRGCDVINDNFILYNPPKELNDWFEIAFAFIELPYEEKINKWIEMIKERPDAHYYMSGISTIMSQFQTLEDLKKVYNCFTNEQQGSYFGQQVEKYLNNNLFVNYFMQNSLSGNIENIITETLKPTLVIFSASWCAPCTLLIPELKEMYNKLKDKVEFVYVSIDEPKTLDAWKNKMTKESISWRAVHSKEGASEIMKTLMIPHIPYALLVNPADMSMERYNIAQKSQRTMLYKQFEIY